MTFVGMVRGTAGVTSFGVESKHTAAQINSANNKTQG
jgi:hypothetical protein